VSELDWLFVSIYVYWLGWLG